MSKPEKSAMTTSLMPTVESQFQCQFYQIPIQFKCDGTTHCVPDGTDEQDCPEAPVISSSTSIPSIKAQTNHKELRVEFQKDKKTAWKSKKERYKGAVIDKFIQLNLFFLDCGKSKSKREEESARQVKGTDADIDKVSVTHIEISPFFRK